MERKVAKKSAVEKKNDPVVNDPFAEIVTEPAAKTRAVKAVKAETKEVKKPAKSAVKPTKTAVVAVADAFAAPATDTEPSKKAPVKAAKAAKTKAAKAVAVKAKAKKAAESRSVAPTDLEEPEAVAVSPIKKATAKSSVKKATKSAVRTKKASLDVTAEIAASEPEVELSPVFKALADVSLPELKKENRARLLMQSPTRLYFYWSIRENPWQQLRKIFGDDLGSYTLVLKLTDLKRDIEKVHPCDAEGNWWFDVEPDGEYQAEIGFYAVNRPYFRIIYSNTIVTPRRSPSPRPASEAQWTVSANKFAEVLDVAGFSRDAFDVAMAGDDHAAAEDATHTAFASLVGTREGIEAISPEDIRYALLALASGFTLEELRWRVSPALFAILQSHVEKLAADKALAALTQHFDIDEAEWTEEEFSAAVYGASLVHFPKTLKTKRIASKGSTKLAPRYNPVSSHSVGK